MQILVLNGPNLHRLGYREPRHYGAQTLDEILAALDVVARRLDVRLGHFQSNAEHELLDRIYQAADSEVDALIFNPAAFTHTSVALRDALLATEIPFVEVHLSNVHAREPFRRDSYFSDIARGVISGFGARGYELALLALAQPGVTANGS